MGVIHQDYRDHQHPGLSAQSAISLGPQGAKSSKEEAHSYSINQTSNPNQLSNQPNQNQTEPTKPKTNRTKQPTITKPNQPSSQPKLANPSSPRCFSAQGGGGWRRGWRGGGSHKMSTTALTPSTFIAGVQTTSGLVGVTNDFLSAQCCAHTHAGRQKSSACLAV